MHPRLILLPLLAVTVLSLHAAGPARVCRPAELVLAGGDRLLSVGAPAVEKDGAWVRFGGRGDGLLVEGNPLRGLARFTVEVRVRPAADGGTEQRFVHFQDGDAHRVLLELRMGGPKRDWSLDTHLFRDAAVKHTLLDRGLTHSAGEWHWVALSYDGTTMRQYVDGRPEGEAAVAFPPMGEGRFSLGMRQDRRSWFRGEIAELRVSDEALPAERLQR